MTRRMPTARRTLLAIALILAITAPALAQTTITYWHSFGDSAPMRNLIDRFNASQSDVIVEDVAVGNYNEMITRLQAAVVSGRVPDVVQLEITRYGLFAERGVLQPLTDLIAADPAWNVGDLIPGIWEAAQYKSVPYVIPFNNSVPVMYYNRDLFRAAGLDPDAPPATWEELLAAARVLTVREGDTTVQWGATAPPQWVRHAFVRQNGGDWMNEDLTRLTLTDPAAVEAYQWLYDLIAVERVAYAEAGIDANNGSLARPDFTSGRTAIYFESTGSLGGIRTAATFDLGVAALPCNLTCAAPIGGATLGILAASSTERQQAAWDFIAWMTTSENNAFWHVETGYMPIRNSSLELQVSQDFYAANPNFKVAIDQFQAASFPRPRPPAMPAIRELELTTWEAIATGAKTVEQALADLASEADALLADN